MWNSYRLTFNYNNGSSSTTTSVDYNSTINYPANPIREGYTFNGWNVSIERMPAENVTITAQWAANNYTVVFDYRNGGNPLGES